MTSGCANSDERDGTSLPTKGTQSFRRERGTLGALSMAAAQSAELSRPYDTRLTLAST